LYINFYSRASHFGGVYSFAYADQLKMDGFQNRRPLYFRCFDIGMAGYWDIFAKKISAGQIIAALLIRLQISSTKQFLIGLRVGGPR
jgi:hypothetical protein